MKGEITPTEEKIIAATLEIIKREGDINQITVRKIADLADVGVGMINYHFNSKDNLIDLAIQHTHTKKIKQLINNCKELELAPLEKVKYLFRFIADRMVENPEYSNIAVYNDFFNQANKQDNSLLIHNYLVELLTEICSNVDNEIKLHLMAHQIGSSLQTLFLQADLFNNNFGIDIYDAEQREELVDLLIDNIIK